LFESLALPPSPSSTLVGALTSRSDNPPADDSGVNVRDTE
jgi:hypothetical protein